MVDDDDLIRRAKGGDGDAWRELYRAHAGRLVVWLRAVSGTDAALGPEDVAAEAWLTAAAKIAEFHGTAQEFGAWLFGIARRVAANARRRAGRRRTWGATPEDLDAFAPPVPAPDDVERTAWIRSVLADLPRREREVVACLEVIGLDVAATAEALGMSATAVRVARHRGLRRLRALTALVAHGMV
ncbi:sigma-70 family RNA polymerase sigma factor [Nocardioides islandensis]|uniref:Sigma-70 family RNA polymerase sigma factor n=1 Tax=Nocardioides islandensis TaxID=433663 RepID=A0A930YIF4_9ACTN|nr:sigma-70 family RNA polymerase sigma factor [Nocardioides islandensis]MBF4763949.1 sigma-70 family RNA polymerase sigma factor [Nocardioides islandensis]